MSARAFITGASGTGKSTLVGTLCDLGLKAIDVDEIPNLARWQDRETGVPANWSPNASQEWHQSNHWIISEDHLRELLSDNDLRVVAGLAANQTDLIHLFDVSVLLQCSENTFLQRIMDRTDNRYGKEPSEWSRILSTYKEMESQMLDLGAIPIDSERDIDLVAREIMELISGAARGSSLRYLAS